MSDTNDNTKPELLPCPFCGGEGDVHTKYHTHVTRAFKMFFVSCCGCFNSTSEWKTKKTARKRWNRRA